MANGTKVTGQLFPRKKYVGGTTMRVYSVFERQTLVQLFGQGYRLHIHTRVYDRSGTGTPSVTYGFLHGCFEDEFPSDALRNFSLSPSVTTPNLPYDATTMTTLPDDGYVMVDLGMGKVDVGLQVSGSAACWVELESWYTLEMVK
jgi:hypothetical protein